MPMSSLDRWMILHMTWPKSTMSRQPATGLQKAAARLGVAAFMFFLVKGLLWLTVPVLLLTRACGAAAEQTAP